MNNSKGKLLEKVLVFLNSISSISREININTLRRYIYLYYLTSSFFNSKNNDFIEIAINKGQIDLLCFDEIIQELASKEFIDINDTNITISDSLNTHVLPLLENKYGTLNDLAKEITSFVNLLNSYDEQYIFTIFFSEPTLESAKHRGLKTITSNDSKLSELLIAFKGKIHDTEIDEYDILTYWMNFILENYYKNNKETV